MLRVVRFYRIGKVFLNLPFLSMNKEGIVSPYLVLTFVFFKVFCCMILLCTYTQEFSAGSFELLFTEKCPPSFKLHDLHRETTFIPTCHVIK